MIACGRNRTIVRAYPELRLRPVGSDEAGPVVDAVIAGLSARSRYLRFHAPVPRLSDALRRQLTTLDGRHRAVVAETVDGPSRTTPVGLVQLADLDGRSADVAIAVVDDWQRRGVGRRLLVAAAELAEQLGLAELRGFALSENVPIRELARRAFPQLRVRFRDDGLELAAALGPAAHTVTHEDVLADLLYRGD
jgi:GNAT superfamily N-acetyltransferase